MLDMVRASKCCHGSSRGGSPRSAPWHRTGCSLSIPKNFFPWNREGRTRKIFRGDQQNRKTKFTCPWGALLSTVPGCGCVVVMEHMRDSEKTYTSYSYFCFPESILEWRAPKTYILARVDGSDLAFTRSCDKFLIVWYKYMWYTHNEIQKMDVQQKWSLKPCGAIFCTWKYGLPRHALRKKWQFRFRNGLNLPRIHRPCLSRWWFQIFFCSPLLGEMVQFDQYFSDGLKPPTSCFLGKVFVQERWQYLTLPNFKKMAVKQKLPQNVHLKYFPKTILTTNQYGRKHRGHSVIH